MKSTGFKLNFDIIDSDGGKRTILVTSKAGMTTGKEILFN